MGGDQPHHLLLTLPWSEPKDLLDDLRKRHPTLKVTYLHLKNPNPWHTEYNIPDDLWKDVTILATLVVLPPHPELTPKLELVQFFMAGTNHVEKHPIWTDSKVPLANASGIHGPSISEWVIMTLLASTHSYNLLHDWQRQQSWGGTGDSFRQLSKTRDSVGQRLGVLGYGSIGRQVGRVAKAMGMDVVAYTASPRKTPESKHDRGFIVPGTGDPNGEIPSAWYSGLDKDSLHEFLSQDLDVLLVSVPLTKETMHFLGEEEFTILSRRNAFLTNISRGQILDQKALISALKAYKEDSERSGKGVRGLRGAALDVTDPEPLPKGHELWTTPNTIVTPHISGVGQAYFGRAFQVLEVNLSRWEKGEKFINEVNRERGYSTFD